jgi:serine/threonine protein kinase
VSLPAQNWFTGTERFQLVRRVGAGGMGVVYQAVDRDRNMRVALKTLPGLDGKLLYSLKQEFRSLADISHPNLARFYELISENGRWFFTMEFIEGVDFIRYVSPAVTQEQATMTMSADGFADPAGAGGAATASSAPMAHTRADIGLLRAALRQLAEGLHALHSFGKLHLDIKPSNLMVTERGQLIILDFGLATNVRQELESGPRKISGTVHYMAPEQARGGNLTAATDWYAVGCTLFEALTGQPVFRGTTRDILFAKQFGVAPAPGELAAGVPADLDQLCVDLLRHHPEERPTGTEILQRLGATPAMPTPAVDDAELMIGRETQMEALHQALARARSGRCTLVFISGASGFGKSTLVHQFLQGVRRRGDAAVLQGRCYEQETVPYKAFDSLIDALERRLEELPEDVLRALLPAQFRALAQIFPVLRRFEEFTAPATGVPETDVLEIRRYAFQALRELIRGLAGLRPLVLFIDDLQWGDLDSAGLLTEILRPPGDVPLLILCAYRTEYAAASRCLKALAGLEREEIQVGPLSALEARDLAQRLLPPDESAHADWIARESKGNPYFVRELAAHKPTSGAQVTLDDVLWRRTQSLSPPALRMLELIAVSGRPLRQSEAFRAATIGADDISLLLALRAGRLVRTTGMGRFDEVETYHDRIRECVVGRLAPPVLVGHHRQLAVTLEQSGDCDAERVGTHYEAAGETRIAARYFTQAADQASNVLAFDRACGLYQHSLAAMGDDPGRQPLAVKFAGALANAGRGPEAAQQYRAAAAGAPSEERLRLEERAAYHFCASGYVDEGRDAYRQVLARFGTGFPASPRRAVAETLAYGVLLGLRGYRFRERSEGGIPSIDLLRADTLWSAGTGLGMVDHTSGGAFVKRSLMAALRLGEPFRVARSLAWECAFLAALGPRFAGTTRRALDTARSIAVRSRNPAAVAWTHLAESYAGLHGGDWGKAAREADEAGRLFREECRDVSWERATAQTCGLMARMACGRYAELGPLAPDLLDEANRRGNLYAATTIQGWVIPQLHLAAGDLAGARRNTQQADSRWTQQGFHLQHVFGWNNRMYACLYEGDGEGALAEAERPWAAVKSSLLFRVFLLRTWAVDARARSFLLAAATTPRRRKESIAGVLKMARSLDREGVVWTSSAAARLRAGVAFLQGDRERSVALLREAERLAGEAGMLQFVASLRYVLGRITGGGEGRRLRQLAQDWMASQQIADPARFAALHVPGFGND